MNETQQLHAQLRTVKGRAVDQLRSQGTVPAVVYSRGNPSQSLMLSGVAFEKMYREIGDSSLVDLKIDTQSAVKVLVQDVQYHPLSHRVTHVDFHQVRMDEKIHADVEIVFDGEAPAVRELGGTLVKNLTHLAIECLPGDLPHEFRIDLSQLKTLDDHLRVENVTIPPNVTLLTDVQETIVLVTPPRSEEELKALEQEVVENVEEIEVIKKKKEEESAESGEAPTDTPAA